MLTNKKVGRREAEAIGVTENTPASGLSALIVNARTKRLQRTRRERPSLLSCVGKPAQAPALDG